LYYDLFVYYRYSGKMSRFWVCIILNIQKQNRYGKFYKYNNYGCCIKYVYVHSHPDNVCLAEMTEGQWSLKYWFSFFIHNILWPLKLQNVTRGAIRNIDTSHIVLILYGLAYIMSLLTPIMLSYNFKGYQDLMS
jgi:hypothetical protein